MNENEIKAIANTFIRIAAELSDLADRLHRLADSKMKKMDSEQICQQKHGIQGCKAVDLGLPSGLKWADRNVGAATPEDYGDYFMWGSTTPDTDKPCDWAHCPFNGGQEYFDEEYFNAHKSEWLTDEGILKPEHDAALAIMGGRWRMPTQAEMLELLDWTTQTMEGNGMRFTSNANGNSIFMPFAGFRYDSDVINVGTHGYALSSSLYAGNANYSHNLYFYCYGYDGVYFSSRYFGFVVRGVHE